MNENTQTYKNLTDMKQLLNSKSETSMAAKKVTEQSKPENTQTSEASTKVNVYQLVTDRIIEELEKGIIPWQKPWTGAALEDGGAINYVTRRPYSMLNQMLLGDEGEYLTFKQVKELNGNVKKGAKSKLVVFFKLLVHEEAGQKDENEENAPKRKTIPMLKYYRIFHVNDCEGIESKIADDTTDRPTPEPIAAAETIVNGYLSQEQKLGFQNDRPSAKAYYSPSSDKVVVPKPNQFNSMEEYYSTTFHELTHSTMKAYRCNREADNANSFFGNKEYSREELVAEIGAAMLCNSAGLESDKAFKNSVAYIQSWLNALKNDNKMIVWAASRAEKAAKYILGEK